MLPKTAIACTSFELNDKAQLLANELGLPVVDVTDHTYPTLLVVTEKHLELRLTELKRSTPLTVNFLSKQMTHRRNKAGGRSEFIARACGVSRYPNISVLDLTAGFGRDGFILATFGARVTLIERSPVIYALLRDGIQREKIDAWFKQLDFHVIYSDAKNYLQDLAISNYPDVIYLDPMYPLSRKSALVKKEMRYMRAVVGEDMDSVELLKMAMMRVKKRVVVKRPRLGNVLADIKPSFSLTGKSSRYDVYVTVS